MDLERPDFIRDRQTGVPVLNHGANESVAVEVARSSPSTLKP